jgi:hypothetical protein
MSVVLQWNTTISMVKDTIFRISIGVKKCWSGAAKMIYAIRSLKSPWTFQQLRWVALLLALIMHEVTSMIKDSIHALTSRITNLKLTNFKGEDMTKAASQLCGAISALEIGNQVPHNIVERLLDIFQTTSVVELNATFRVMRIQQRTLGMNFVRAEIMNLAESLYSDLSSKGEWNGVANPGDDSVFLGQQETVCWDCSETGHRARDMRCKRPKKHSQKKSNLRKGQASG